MQEQDIYEYIWLGTALRYLMDASSNRQWVVGDASILFNIDELFRYLDKFGLVVTGRAGYQLQDFRTDLAERYTEPEVVISGDDANRLTDIVSRLRPTLDAEARGQIAFVVTSKRYPIENLLNGMADLVGDETYAKLPLIAQVDFDEAGRCIAFERSTAAAFHLLRGTEAMLRAFYAHVVKRNRVNPPMWGSITTDLRSRSKPPSKELLDTLDALRTNFRNPTQHPEKVYDIHEAQDLLGLCVDAVRRMAAALP